MSTLIQKAGIYLDIDGAPLDLSEVSWYQKAPCGCVCGVTMAYLDADLCVTTAEQAMAEFHETPHERQKYVDLGFTCFADRRERVRELLTLDCPHDPKYGKPPRPQVEGYSWAAVYKMGGRPKLMHLVPDIAVEDARERRYGADNGAPLCGGKREFHWHTEWYALDGKVECKRCWTKAAS